MGGWVKSTRSLMAAAGALGKALGTLHTGVTWEDRCGCTGCTNSNANAILLTGSSLSIAGTQSGLAPVGIYQSPTGGTVTFAAPGSSPTAWAPVAFYSRASLLLGANTYVKYPFPAAPAAADPKRVAVLALGSCTMLGEFGARSGIWCGDDVSIPTPNFGQYFGSVTAGYVSAGTVHQANIAGGKNNNGFCGSDSDSQANCPTNVPADCPLTGLGDYWSTYDISIPTGSGGGGNGPNMCINMRAAHDASIPTASNNGVMGGTVWAGHDFSMGQNPDIVPVTGTMLGSTPVLVGVQSLSVR